MRLIDADELKKKAAMHGHSVRPLVTAYHMCVSVHDIDDASTIEAEPVKHGRWIVKNGRIECDQCEALWAVCPNKDVRGEELKSVYKTEKFCYNCGAKMDGGAENG